MLYTMRDSYSQSDIDRDNAQYQHLVSLATEEIQAAEAAVKEEIS